MLALRLARHLREELRLDEGAHDGPAQQLFDERRTVSRRRIQRHLAGG